MKVVPYSSRAVSNYSLQEKEQALFSPLDSKNLQEQMDIGCPVFLFPDENMEGRILFPANLNIIPKFCKKHLPMNQLYTKRPFVIRVYSGGSINEQVDAFLSACKAFIDATLPEVCSSRRIIIEVVNNTHLRPSHSEDDICFQSPGDLVDWLFHSDAHFIITQGLHMNTISNPFLSWTTEDIRNELRK